MNLKIDVSIVCTLFWAFPNYTLWFSMLYHNPINRSLNSRALAILFMSCLDPSSVSIAFISSKVVGKFKLWVMYVFSIHNCMWFQFWKHQMEKIIISYWFGRPLIAFWIAGKKRFFQWTYVYTSCFLFCNSNKFFCPISFMTINLWCWSTPNQTYVQFNICDMVSAIDLHVLFHQIIFYKPC